MIEFENKNVWVVLINEEKHLLYMGDNTADITEISILQNWELEKSEWDQV